MSVERLGLIVCGLSLCTPVPAAAEGPPDAEFLEYLGMWEETDEEWLLQDEMLEAEDEERSDSPQDAEESPESEDES